MKYIITNKPLPIEKSSDIVCICDTIIEVKELLKDNQYCYPLMTKKELKETSRDYKSRKNNTWWVLCLDIKGATVLSPVVVIG